MFTQVPFLGNPVAVIIEGDQFTDDQMQRIANWTHLSETTFICAPTNPEADYRLRIFTPHEELPFAGHPTIGSARVALNHGVKPQHDGYLVQECKKGLVKIYLHDDQLAFALPEPQFLPVSDEIVQNASTAMGLTDFSKVKLAEMVDVGIKWLVMELDGSSTVLSLLTQDEALIKALPDDVVGVSVFAPRDDGADFEVRSFAPLEGAHEDPVCGSGNGAVAAMVKRHQLVAGHHYIANQGQMMGRQGVIVVDLDQDGQILVGGHAVECIKGQIVRP